MTKLYYLSISSGQHKKIVSHCRHSALPEHKSSEYGTIVLPAQALWLGKQKQKHRKEQGDNERDGPPASSIFDTKQFSKCEARKKVEIWEKDQTTLMSPSSEPIKPELKNASMVLGTRNTNAKPLQFYHPIQASSQAFPACLTDGGVPAGRSSVRFVVVFDPIFRDDF